MMYAGFSEIATIKGVSDIGKELFYEKMRFEILSNVIKKMMETEEI